MVHALEHPHPDGKRIAGYSVAIAFNALPLTLPHMLVRLVVAEQLYRAAALLANHPYHRA